MIETEESLNLVVHKAHDQFRRQFGRRSQGQEVRQDHAGVPEEVAIAALGVLPGRPPRDARQNHCYGCLSGRRLRPGRTHQMPAVIAFPQAFQCGTAGIEVVNAARQAGKIRTNHVDLDGVEGTGGGVRPEEELLSVSMNAPTDSRPHYQESGQVEQARRPAARSGDASSYCLQYWHAGWPGYSRKVHAVRARDELERVRLVAPVQVGSSPANALVGVLGS